MAQENLDLKPCCADLCFTRMFYLCVLPVRVTCVSVGSAVDTRELRSEGSLCRLVFYLYILPVCFTCVFYLYVLPVCL